MSGQHQKATTTSWKPLDFTTPCSPPSPFYSSPSTDSPGLFSEDGVQGQLNASFASAQIGNGYGPQDGVQKAEKVSRKDQEADVAVGASFGSGSGSFAYETMDVAEAREVGMFLKKKGRRDTRMRFSFLMTEDGDAGEESRGGKGRRPSLLAPEEVEVSVATVPTPRDIRGTDDVDVEDGTKTTARQASSVSSRTPQSSVRTSFYFDAVEDQDSSNQLATITEDEDEDSTNVASVHYHNHNSSNSKVPPKEERGYLVLLPEEERKRAHSAQQSFSTSTSASASFASDLDDDFDDRIVLADVPYPPSHLHCLPCTRASATVTARLKSSAFSLLRYEESETMFSALMIRLERMLDTEFEISRQDKRHSRPSLSKLVRRLRDWLIRIADGRVGTGEESRVVEHELMMVEWMVEACREGVMHIKAGMLVMEFDLDQ
ncbi:hypothetical protein K505DRAFT_392935 [Melanomma pulvis-pyrius CBS 109.77]|uniref:Uncharacterized protein n=1 Tax=Melanomma pulvis-pyrius CBS 109.77 TaxID=1314802 RepID=A0A6A6X028_9PLEO|nr:hypothetical protein K505DRAFT_392935 [Melanomma pulvis-pyrius CBS 109.77]